MIFGLLYGCAIFDEEIFRQNICFIALNILNRTEITKDNYAGSCATTAFSIYNT